MTDGEVWALLMDGRESARRHCGRSVSAHFADGMFATPAWAGPRLCEEGEGDEYEEEMTTGMMKVGEVRGGWRTGGMREV